MKKRYLLIIILLFLIMPNVYGICSPKAYTDMKAKAFSTQLKWDFYNDGKTQYFTVTIYNMDKEVMLEYGGREYVSKKGEKVLINDFFVGGSTYEFNLYGEYDSNCPEEFLYTKNLEIPKYNVYSEREECLEYEDFPLCNKWYKGNINSEKEFNTYLEKYKESIKPKEEKTEKDDNNFIDRVIELFNEYTVIFILTGSLIIGTLIYFVIRLIIRRKNRIKIGMKG